MDRYNDAKPEIINGRKVWIARRNTSHIAEVWLHLHPAQKPVKYLSGSSLTEGSAAENATYLAHLLHDAIANAPPLTLGVESLWDADKAESEAIDRFEAAQLAVLEAEAC